MRKQHMRFGAGFSVGIRNRSGQAASMTIAPGKSEGGPDNRHRGSDQWLFVMAGRGIATVNGRRQSLEAGDLLLIERGERHEVRNTGRWPLRTLNIYVPPAYRADGNPLPRGSSGR